MMLHPTSSCCVGSRCFANVAVKATPDMTHSRDAGDRPPAPGHHEETPDWYFELEHGWYTGHILAKAFEASTVYAWEEPHYPAPPEMSTQRTDLDDAEP